jgi:hypothetical protein
MTITNNQRKKLKDLMGEFQALRERMMNEYKETIERRYSPSSTSPHLPPQFPSISFKIKIKFVSSPALQCKASNVSSANYFSSVTSVGENSSGIYGIVVFDAV